MRTCCAPCGGFDGGAVRSECTPYGVIAPDGGSNDVFVYISAVEHADFTGVSDDRCITFDIEAGGDGRKRATNLALA